ncbi:MAG: DUF2062 domain-containing protein [Paracoccus sp. (in: a-proteobacteria)]|uniref:DUF2062 domain-containing protein n=1 Tax=Paracoccus sp. TaxID=267 RepID=UPI0026E0E862|nr:DUF2062 domain-containing protein [Paracoccus sp. (in: a-proteobacteria)]MDO5622466.1 DUF2062 domain-containing protein [Paracoccus sp. (in: a-proteobacteria)]
MFKRRKPRSYGEAATRFFYPKGGWGRASRYMIHRVRRLPDQPHRVGRGVAAGVFISFTPLFGLHFLGAAAIAWLIGGNILAALLATFVGNPLTFPFIAVLAVQLGRWMLGLREDLGAQRILGEISRAVGEFYNNVLAPFSQREVHWDKLGDFFHQIFLPYLLGGIIPGIIAGVIAHYLTVPLVRGHHRRRERKMAERIARLRADKDKPE